MAQNTDLNVSPYYDDYDETKNFHRILFRPSNAIQARELTQLQSILQNQVERFGNHIFDEGSLVMGGTVTVNTLYDAVKVNSTNPNGSGTTTTETYRTASVGKYFLGETSGVVGKVINSVKATTGGDPLTLYVTYVKSNADSSTTSYSKFVDNEELHEVTVNAAGVYSDASNTNEFKTILPSAVAGHSSSTATGSAATVRGGVFYTRGFFVRCDEQTIILDKYTNTPTYRVGLQIVESLQSSSDDDSLNDNAAGTSNENAPGANRLKVALTLINKTITGTQDIDNFIELSRVEEGIITKQTAITAYNTLERTLARRTYDESGDYIVKPFNVELREHYNSTLNNGVYKSSNTSIPGDKTKFVSIVSPGKGYVKGFEVNKQSQSLITLDKSREIQDSGALAVPFEIGNYYNVNTVFGQAEFGTGIGSITPFGLISLRNTIKDAVEGGNGVEIGQARVRFFNCVTPATSSGGHSDTSLFKIHLFDIRMYTELTVANTSHAYTAGQRIEGTVSGAKGTVAVSSAHGDTTVFLIDVEGEFITSDTVRLEHETSGGKAVSAIVTHSTDRVRQVYQASRSSGAAVFAADTITTDSQFVLTGTFTGNGSDATQTGVNTKFSQELKEGDIIVAPSGTTKIVLSVASDTSIELTGNGVAENGKYIRQRAAILEQEKTVSIMPTPKNFVSSVTPNTVVVRKQAVTSNLSSGAGTISVGSDETLIAEDPNDYILSIHEAQGTESDPEGNNEGTVLDIAGAGGTPANFVQISSSSGGAISIAGANNSKLGSSATDVLKVIYAVTKNVTDDNAAKTLQRSNMVNVTTTASAASGSSASAEVYGTNINDERITLGVPDVYAVRAIYESNDTTVPLPPKLTVASGFANATPGDRITGSVSGAVGKIIQVPNSTTIFFYYVTEILFTTDDIITNETSTNTSTNSRACSAVTVDSKNITNNFLLDDGQRDGYYGLASIIRKKSVPIPTKKILVVFDYFKAGGGNFFTVNSYSGLEYENIPNYIPNITDPNGREQDGEIELTDAIDFRSYVNQLHDPSTALDPTAPRDVDDITSQPFAMTTETFIGSSGLFDLPKSGQALTTTKMEHFLPRIDKISLSSDGDFIVSKGEPADEPSAPSTPSNSILLHTVYIPAYTRDLSKVSVQSQDHKRFTMKDIGRIQGRVKNLERVTSLNSLEQETSLTQIQDADGLDRFKSGFMTDNFRGHKTGDVFHPDYKIAVDRTTGTLRPQHSSKFADVSLVTGSSSGYQKTGDMITLPYTEEPYVTIGKASSTEFVNPYDVVLFNGTVELSPSRDLWFDTQRLPAVRRSVEGDFDTILAGTQNALGTVWNNWQSDWLGEPITTVEEPTNRTVTSPTPRVGRRGGVSGGSGRQNEMMDAGTRFEIK